MSENKEILVHQVKHCCDCGKVFEDTELVKDTNWLKEMEEEDERIVYNDRNDHYYWNDESELCIGCEMGSSEDNYDD